MLKLWLVKFPNGEEWHVFGEKEVVSMTSISEGVWEQSVYHPVSITFVRAYRV